MADFPVDFEHYLTSLDYTEIKDFDSLKNFEPKAQDGQKLPISMRSGSTSYVLPLTRIFPDHNQERIDDAASLKLSSAEYEAHLKNLRDIARRRGIDLMLEENDIDVIIGPADSQLTKIAAAAGNSIS